MLVFCHAHGLGGESALLAAKSNAWLSIASSHPGYSSCLLQMRHRCALQALLSRHCNTKQLDAMLHGAQLLSLQTWGHHQG